MTIETPAVGRRTVLGAAVGAAALTSGPALAAAPPDILVGAVYPLSGNAAPIGNDARVALETAAAIINGHHDVPMLLGQGGGLPALGGAKIKLIFADSQNSPQIAQSEAERLITQDKVVAIIGSYTSATAVTISQICNRYEVPYISAENSAPSLSEQGLTWFFRPSPTDIAYQASTPSLAVEAARLRAANADVLMPSSYTNDAILLVRSMHNVGYTPKAIMAQDAGFIDPAFIAAVGPLAEGVMSRSSYASDAEKTRPAIPKVNALYKSGTKGKDLDDLSAREFTALQVLADAINRAGSTKNTALQAALKTTDIPGNQTIMPWKGIKFDATGQNILGNPVIQQYQHGAWHTIFPADVATADAIWTVGT